MAEASFCSNESNSFIHISNDNRVHLWDTDTRKERRTYVEKQHLAHSYTCSSWRSGKKENLGYFAVGASDGVIIVWDLTRGVVVKTFGKINESPAPTSLVFSNDSKSLLVSSAQNHVVQYDLTSGAEIRSVKAGKKGVLKIALNPKVDVIAVGGTSVRLIEIQSGRKRKLEAQFSGEIVALAFTQCGRYLAVAGSGSREILLFDIQAGAEATPLTAIAVIGEPKNINVRSVSTVNAGARIEVICVFEDSNGCYIRYPIDTNGNQIAASVCQIIGNSEIMAGCFGNTTGGNSEKEITVATGSKNAPLFTTLLIEDSDENILGSVNVGKALVTTENVPADKVSEVTENNVTIHLGPHESGGTKRPLLASVEEEDSLALGNKKRSKKNDEKKEELVVIDGELTLEQRLDSLSASLLEIEKGSHISLPASNTVDGAPSTNSLVVLIDQALQSGDDALLEQSLACDDVAIVDATAKRLAPGRVVQLLRRLVAKFEKRPSRGLLLTRWLAAVLRFHTSFLISVPDLSTQLAGLSQMLEQRLSSYTRLASLGGRLDLLMSQINSQDITDGKNSNGKKKNETEATPRQVYREV